MKGKGKPAGAPEAWHVRGCAAGAGTGLSYCCQPGTKRIHPAWRMAVLCAVGQGPWSVCKDSSQEDAHSWKLPKPPLNTRGSGAVRSGFGPRNTDMILRFYFFFLNLNHASCDVLVTCEKQLLQLDDLGKMLMENCFTFRRHITGSTRY